MGISGEEVEHGITADPFAGLHEHDADLLRIWVFSFSITSISLHGAALASIQECLCGANGDAFILRMVADLG